MVSKTIVCKHLPSLETLCPAANRIINKIMVDIVLLSSNQELEAISLRLIIIINSVADVYLSFSIDNVHVIVGESFPPATVSSMY